VFAKEHENKPPAVGLRPDAPPYALHGPYWVGTREFVVEPGSERPLPVTAWYPALNENGSGEYAVYDMGIGDLTPSEASLITEGHALAEGAPALADAPYPPVVISHGLGGSRLAYFGLSEHLASYGFVAIGIEHIGTALRERIQGTSDIGSPNTIQSLYYRPSDVARAIAFADALTAADGQLAGLIDTDHIAVWGHSTGGSTVFQAGGARIDFPALNTWCASKKADRFAEESCQFVSHEDALAELYGVVDPEAALFPPLWDTRVDALVAAAPGGELHVFGDEGIAAVQVPTLIMFGSLDSYVSPEYNALWAYDNIGSQNKALVKFENGDHMMFANCPASFKDLCGYDAVWDIDRAHDLTNHFTTAFLLATLKGDTEAAAALAPDAVSFPGIEYQTTGF
jgi:predicted dienelactone hydrolase